MNVIDADFRRLIHYAATTPTSQNLVLLQKSGASLVEVDKFKTNALVYAAGAGSLENVKYLLQQYPDMAKQKNKNGKGAIHAAIMNGHVHVVEYLLSKSSELAK